jgi:hypothetical protein
VKGISAISAFLGGDPRDVRGATDERAAELLEKRECRCDEERDP